MHEKDTAKRRYYKLLKQIRRSIFAKKTIIDIKYHGSKWTSELLRFAITIYMESTKWTAQFNKSSFGTRSLLSILISTVENLERKTLRFLQIIPTAICRFQLMWMKKSSKNYFARHLGAFIKLFTYNKEM